MPLKNSDVGDLLGVTKFNYGEIEEEIELALLQV